MKCNLLSMAGLIAMLTACSSDELIEAQQDPITFSVSTENVTRAKSIATTTDNFTEFTLYADYKANGGGTTTLYLKEGKVEKSSGNWALSDGDIYWPASGTLDFYAVANYDPDTNDKKTISHSTTDGKTTVTHSVNATAANQTDLIYAVTAAQSKPESGTAVSLHFRHALSQITFKAKCVNPHLKVSIKELILAGVKGSGTLKLPSKSTTNELSASTSNETIGSWTFDESVTASSQYKLENLTTEIKGNMSVASNMSPTTDKCMLLIPQATTQWTPANKISNTSTGSYVALKCLIYNYVDDNTNNVQLYPTSGTEAGYVYIPIAFDWKAGHKYIYTFVFGGKSDSNGGGYDADGNKVLTPITYNVDVNEFVNESNKDINM